MMMRYISIFAFIFILFLFACKDNKRENAISEIRKVEKRIDMNSVQFRKSTADSLLQSYDSFIATYPKDTAAANMMFNAVRLCQHTGEFGKAIKYAGDLRESFPNHRSTADAMYYQAFIYETSLGDKENAKRYYKMFLEKYPNHELANDVKLTLEQIDMPLEQVVKGFEKNVK